MKKGAHNFLKLAVSRKTCYEFNDKKVTDSELNKILESGRWAPSFSNIQPWRFVIIKQAELISNLMRLVSYGGFHTNPPLLIALVISKEIVEGEHRGIVKDKVGNSDGSLSLGMAVQNMVLEATDLKIDSAILTPNNNGAVSLLRLKPTDSVPLLIALGYEKKGAFQKKRHRKEISSLILRKI